MKKRSCRMTSEEKLIHEFAVKVRKMTDKQLYDFINSNKGKEINVEDFLNTLETRTVNGIGPVTVHKIKEFAIKEGFVRGNQYGRIQAAYEKSRKRGAGGKKEK